MSKVDQSKKLDVERIVFIGRTFEEYLAMFSLSVEQLRDKRILDCPAGACSFTSLGNKLGLDLTACDIAYYHPVDALEKKGYKDVEHTMINMEKVKGNYIWDFFEDVGSLKQHRLSALRECVKDMRSESERYVPVTLPTLPFQNGEFDLLLSAHFLFMYADRLDFHFHLETLKELLRVTKEEVRIFPLVDFEGNRYEYLDELISYLEETGCFVEEIKVNYEFQNNANSMLRIIKR